MPHTGQGKAAAAPCKGGAAHGRGEWAPWQCRSVPSRPRVGSASPRRHKTPKCNCTLVMTFRLTPPKSRFCRSATAQDSKVQLHLGKVHLYLDKVQSPRRGTSTPLIRKLLRVLTRASGKLQRRPGKAQVQLHLGATNRHLCDACHPLRPAQNRFCESAPTPESKMQLHLGKMQRGLGKVE